ncbi:MAG TPA: TolC family protein [Phycisphaerales bacterium]|nr:TolC family protein [Phycisphaerales bacterium]
MPIALAAAGVGGGCRSYEPRPLDLPATRAAWLTRSPSDESVRQFAERLAQAEGRGEEPGGEAVFDLSDGLTLAEAEPVALLFNRELRLARLEADVARVSADHAGRWDDPVAGVDVERIVSGVPDPWVVAGTLGLTIPISGRLAAEKDRAGADHEAELRRLAAREWATRAALRERWIDWSAQAHRARLAHELVARLGGIAELARRQERAGVMSRVEAQVFGVELAGSEAELITARARLAELELQLRDILGLAPEAPVQLIESVAFTPRLTDPTSTREAMESGNPELAAARAEYEAAERALGLEVRKQYPDLTIGPGYGTDEGDERVLLGLQFPIPLWNRNRQSVAEATARREVARGRFESTYEHVASRLAIARARHEAGRAMRQAVEDRVAPLADEQDADVRRIAELGGVEALLLLQAVRSQSEAKLRLVDARAAEAIGAILLEELIGPPAPVRSSAVPGPSEPGARSGAPARPVPSGGRP